MDDLLSGILVAVPATRRAAETEALIRRWGGTSLVGPLLEELPIEDEGPLRSATEEIVAAPATWSVHLTGVGTCRWFVRAAEWGLGERLLEVPVGGHIIARTEVDRSASQRAASSSEWTPPGETSAEMAEWLGPSSGLPTRCRSSCTASPCPA